MYIICYLVYEKILNIKGVLYFLRNCFFNLGEVLNLVESRFVVLENKMICEKFMMIIMMINNLNFLRYCYLF